MCSTLFEFELFMETVNITPTYNMTWKRDVKTWREDVTWKRDVYILDKPMQ